MARRGLPAGHDRRDGIAGAALADVLGREPEAVDAARVQPADRIHALRRLVREVAALHHVEAVRARDAVERGLARERAQLALAAQRLHRREDARLERRELGRRGLRASRKRREPERQREAEQESDGLEPGSRHVPIRAQDGGAPPWAWPSVASSRRTSRPLS